MNARRMSVAFSTMAIFTAVACSSNGPNYPGSEASGTGVFVGGVGAGGSASSGGVGTSTGSSSSSSGSSSGAGNGGSTGGTFTASSSSG